MRARWWFALAVACGPAEDEEPGDAVSADAGDSGVQERGDGGATPLPYAARVVDFSPGPGAGFGQDRFPDIVLGPPSGRGTGAGSLTVLSLGVGGQIVLDFGESVIVDGAGPDFVVFENPFWAGGDPEQVFAEPGEVSVSEDGEQWFAFPCDPAGDGRGRYPGCAGWTPTERYDASDLVPLDAALSGGDSFDLAEIGLSLARYVRIRDLSTEGAAPTAGFDLDAVGAVHLAPAR